MKEKMTLAIQIHSERVTYLILLLIIESVFSQTNVGSTEDQSCKPTCSCCATTFRCTPESVHCDSQCKAGFFGLNCVYTCPTNCKRCSAHPNKDDSKYWGKGYCTECKNGYYSTSEFFQCQLDCPAGCQTCRSGKECISCKDDYRLEGTTCRHCKTGCASCTSYDECSQCDDGYYNSGGTASNLNCVACSYGCSHHCNKESGTCTCKPGFTGDKCDISCVQGHYLQGNTCKQCKPGCAKCSSDNDCTLCLDGYYSSGTGCLACSDGCANQCGKDTGACSCKSGFDGEKCDRCAANFVGTACDRCVRDFHGTLCDKKCPQNCKNNKCMRYRGECIQGCIERFTGRKCTDCVEGRFGKYCSLTCPENCVGACSRYLGHCQLCNTNFAGRTCDGCIAGRRGHGCSSACPSGCKDNRCDRSTGTCDSCQAGRYGEQCNLLCPPNCPQRTCVQETGACIGGCTSGYSGDMCCQKGSNCISCSYASRCSECVPGKYGGACADDCPTKCADNICDKNNGTCNRCKDGFQGDTCAIVLQDGGFEGGTPWSAIVGGVAGALVLIVAVVVLIVLFRKRLDRTSDGRQTDDTHTYINVTRVSDNETEETRKAVRDKTRQLQKYQQHKQKYQQKEVEYAEKAVQIKHELAVIQGAIYNPANEDGATSGAENQTYESLNQQEAEDNPYAALGTHWAS